MAPKAKWLDLKLAGRKLNSAPEGYTARSEAQVKRWLAHTAQLTPSQPGPPPVEELEQVRNALPPEAPARALPSASITSVGMALQDDGHVDHEHFYELRDSTDSFLRRMHNSPTSPCAGAAPDAALSGASNGTDSAAHHGDHSAKENAHVLAGDDRGCALGQEHTTELTSAPSSLDWSGPSGARQGVVALSATCNASVAPPEEAARTTSPSHPRPSTSVSGGSPKSEAHCGDPAASERLGPLHTDSRDADVATRSTALTSANARSVCGSMVRGGSEHCNVAATPAAIEVATERYLGMAQAVQPPLAAEDLALHALRLAVEDRISCHRYALLSASASRWHHRV